MSLQPVRFNGSAKSRRFIRAGACSDGAVRLERRHGNIIPHPEEKQNKPSRHCAGNQRKQNGYAPVAMPSQVAEGQQSPSAGS
jgi:hypothetical protein